MGIRFSPGCACCNDCGCDGELPNIINAVVSGFTNDPAHGFDNLSNLNKTYFNLKSTNQSCLYLLNLSPPILIGNNANQAVATQINITLTPGGPIGNIGWILPGPTFFAYVFEPIGLNIPPYPCIFNNIKLTFFGVSPGGVGALNPNITMIISSS